MSVSKFLGVTSLLLSLSLFASSNNPFEQRAPFQSATIHYSIGGSSEGDATLYVKEYGKYLAERETSKMSMFGFSKEEDKLTITTPEWVYNIDMLEKTGTKTTNMEKYLKQEYENLSSSDKKKVQKNAKKFGTNMAQTLGGDVKFNAAMIHGYSCDKATMMGMTSYSIHNTAILLKMEGSTLGMEIKKEATKIDNGSVSSSHFKIPEGISVTYDAQADAMMKQQAKSIIEMLLNPKKQSSNQSVPSAPAAQKSTQNHPAPKSASEPNDNKELDEASQAVGNLFKSLF
jgi:hypothetical protein